jgi:zinc-finger of transposase IS204/IS1001/IS1096/IS1165
VQIVARTRAGQALCPSCGVPSDKVHSRYRRRLADVAVGGRRAVIVLLVRRLLGDNQACQQRTFAEQVVGLTVRYGRRTPLQASHRSASLSFSGVVTPRVERVACAWGVEVLGTT